MGLKLIAFIVAIASVAASAAASFNRSNYSYYYGWAPRHSSNNTQNSREIIVGGDSHWQFGFDYSTWAFRNAPFYVNDTLGTTYDSFVFFNSQSFCGISAAEQTVISLGFLSAVFKYDPPSENNTHPHSVYLFNDFWSFRQCNLKRARMLANWSDGAGDGFKFELARPWRPYYFACGESQGFHCTNGNMKFFVVPAMRWWNK